MVEDNRETRRPVPAGAGMPIGPTFSIPIGRANDQLRAMLAIVDAVHSDGVLPATRVVRRMLPPGEHGAYEPRTGEIIISLAAPDPALTLIHEIGHILDRFGLGQSGMFASPLDPVMATWRTTIATTRAVATLDHLLTADLSPGTIRHVAYIRRYDELWARSYTQYVVGRGRALLATEFLDRQRARLSQPTTMPYYWHDHDFAAVAGAIDDLFRRLGWIR